MDLEDFLEVMGREAPQRPLDPENYHFAMQDNETIMRTEDGVIPDPPRRQRQGPSNRRIIPSQIISAGGGGGATSFSQHRRGMTVVMDGKASSASSASTSSSSTSTAPSTWFTFPWGLFAVFGNDVGVHRSWLVRISGEVKKIHCIYTLLVQLNPSVRVCVCVCVKLILSKTIIRVDRTFIF